MAHSRRFGPGRNSSQRKTAWNGGPHTSAAPGSPQTITASGTTVVTTGIIALSEGTTLIRTRGVLTMSLQNAAAQANGFTGAFGILAAGNEAFTAGAGSLPDPQDEPGDERWLYHKFFQIVSNTATTADIGQDVLASLRVDIDSKAMRKVSPDLVICAVLGVVEVGTATMAWMLNSRLLFKLP